MAREALGGGPGALTPAGLLPWREPRLWVCVSVLFLPQSQGVALSSGSLPAEATSSGRCSQATHLELLSPVRPAPTPSPPGVSSSCFLSLTVTASWGQDTALVPAVCTPSRAVLDQVSLDGQSGSPCLWSTLLLGSHSLLFFDLLCLSHSWTKPPWPPQPGLQAPVQQSVPFPCPSHPPWGPEPGSRQRAFLGVVGHSAPRGPQTVLDKGRAQEALAEGGRERAGTRLRRERAALWWLFSVAATASAAGVTAHPLEGRSPSSKMQRMIWGLQRSPLLHTPRSGRPAPQ